MHLRSVDGSARAWRERCITWVAMSDQDAKKPAKAPEGKPTIEPDNHDQNVGQRERTHSVGSHGKPTIEPDTHDANVGQRDPLEGRSRQRADSTAADDPCDDFDANAGQRLSADECSGTAENKPRVGPNDVDKTRGQRPTRDNGDNDDLGALGAPGRESRIAPNGTLSDDSEVE